MADLNSLQREWEDAKIRRYEALQRFGVGSPQFAAASELVAALETKIKEAKGR